MNTHVLPVLTVRLLGDHAMHPIAPRPTRPAALGRLAGSSPRRCRALLDTLGAAHSGASNCFF